MLMVCTTHKTGKTLDCGSYCCTNQKECLVVTHIAWCQEGDYLSGLCRTIKRSSLPTYDVVFKTDKSLDLKKIIEAVWQFPLKELKGIRKRGDGRFPGGFLK